MQNWITKNILRLHFLHSSKLVEGKFQGPSLDFIDVDSILRSSRVSVSVTRLSVFESKYLATFGLFWSMSHFKENCFGYLWIPRSGPNIWQLMGYLEACHCLKKLLWFNFGKLLENLGYIWFHHLVTLGLAVRWTQILWMIPFERDWPFSCFVRKSLIPSWLEANSFRNYSLNLLANQSK